MGADHEQTGPHLTRVLEDGPAGNPPVLGRTAPSAVTPAALSSSTIPSTSCWASWRLSPCTVGGTG